MGPLDLCQFYPNASSLTLTLGPVDRFQSLCHVRRTGLGSLAFADSRALLQKDADVSGEP